ncbi:MAG: repressor LexA [Candidatus Marinimicrobia bacterium]|nr:repressor LexA [Candidatus Neomarinimicrobiota bacterium]|tara:strand:- start:35576 stop:36169 length:594 start_codon:yes stop_codon:yes gene_type:complete
MLSPKKQKFVDYIKDFTNQNHRPPTFIEIMKGLNFKSLGTVNWYIVELEKDGIIERVKGFNGKRALSILESHIANQLPLLGVVSAGSPIDVFDTIEYVDAPEVYCKPNNFMLKVAGDSMIDDGILDGDYIVAKKIQVAEPGDTVIASIDGEATLKRFYVGSNGIELHPRNDNYSIIHIDEQDELIIQGKLVAVIREY